MRIAIVGFGVVGRAVVSLLVKHGDRLYHEHGISPRVVGVIDSGGAAVCERGLNPQALLAAKQESGTAAALDRFGLKHVDPEAIIGGCDADVLIEATPSLLSDPGPAIGHLKAAFRAGLHVVTVNKAPLALALPALAELAAFNRVEFRYSGTVGAGLPVLALARQCALGDEIQRVRAILNGTTNFILWRMHEAGQDFDAALAEAVRLGYAEADPSADIDGLDTATKVVILANLILKRPVTLADVSVKGIRGMATECVAQALKRNQRIKLVGELGEALRVSPLAVKAGSRLDVPANLNMVTLTLRNGGDVTLIGRGAGGLETATAVVRDLLDIWHTVGSRS